MAATNPMSCPNCGVPMNHHADKVDYNAPADAAIDPQTGGVIAEFHTCPRCGKTHSRLPPGESQ